MQTVLVYFLVFIHAYARRQHLTVYERTAMLIAIVGIYVSVKHNFRVYFDKHFQGDDCNGTEIAALSTIQVAAMVHYIFVPLAILTHNLPLWKMLLILALIAYMILPSMMYVIIFLIEYGTRLASIIKFLVL